MAYHDPYIASLLTASASEWLAVALFDLEAERLEQAIREGGGIVIIAPAWSGAKAEQLTTEH